MSKVSKDKLMKDLFKFPKETLLFVKEVARINEDIILEETIDRILKNSNIQYDMFSLSEEKTSGKSENQFKRLDLALEFRTEQEQLEFIVFIENQTTNDKTMLLRMMEYITATLLEKLQSKDYNISKGLPRPIPILIYLANDNCSMPVSLEQYFKTPQIAAKGVKFETYLVDLGGKEYFQVLENLSTTSIFLQLMKALIAQNQGAFIGQIQVLKENLKSKDYEISRFYETKLEMIASEFINFVDETNVYTQSEVKNMALSLKEIQRISGVDKIIKAEQEGKVQILIESYNKYKNFEEVRKDLYNKLLEIFEEYGMSARDREFYLKQLK